ncbi:unnamed protein product [Linum trigynum]|uniref:Uncharacterized protein n=1 Tax=Linum trigynum TaxID=586398 RepID=A0AAV2EKT3_9ROSI
MDPVTAHGHSLPPSFHTRDLRGWFQGNELILMLMGISFRVTFMLPAIWRMDWKIWLQVYRASSQGSSFCVMQVLQTEQESRNLTEEEVPLH